MIPPANDDPPTQPKRGDTFRLTQCEGKIMCSHQCSCRHCKSPTGIASAALKMRGNGNDGDRLDNVMRLMLDYLSYVSTQEVRG